VSRMTVDALWRSERLAVELDGYEGHRSRGQTERDRRRDLQLRMAGFTAIRYTWRQINDEPDRVAADLQRQLSSSAPSA
jgi:very-short-patch-repair endonuclease